MTNLISGKWILHLALLFGQTTGKLADGMLYILDYSYYSYIYIHIHNYICIYALHCIAGSLWEGGCCVGSALRTEEFIGAPTLHAQLLNFHID